MYPNPTWSRPVAFGIQALTLTGNTTLTWDGAESATSFRIVSPTLNVNNGSTARDLTLPAANVNSKAKGAPLTIVAGGSADLTVKLSTGTTLQVLPAGATLIIQCLGSSATDWKVLSAETPNRVSMVRKVTLAAVTDFNAAATTQAVNVGAALPAGAVVTNVTYNLTQEFSGGAVSAATIAVGVSGTAGAFMAATNVFTGAGTGYKRNDPSAITTNASGVQVIATITTTTANVSALTAGSITVYVGFDLYV